MEKAPMTKGPLLTLLLGSSDFFPRTLALKMKAVNHRKEEHPRRATTRVFASVTSPSVVFPYSLKKVCHSPEGDNCKNKQANEKAPFLSRVTGPFACRRLCLMPDK